MGGLSGRSGPRPCNPGAAPFLTSCLRAVPRASARKPGRGAGGRGGWRRRATRPQVYANPLRARLPPPLRGPSREKRRPLRGTPPLRSARRLGQRAPGAASGGGTRAASGERRGGAGSDTGGGPARGQVGSRGRQWAAAACRSGCAPSRRCSRGCRPRAPRSSRGPCRPVCPATASTRRDGVRDCARGRTSKRGPRGGREAGETGRQRRSHLPRPHARAAGRPAPEAAARRGGSRGRAPAQRAPHAPGGCGAGEEK